MPIAISIRRRTQVHFISRHNTRGNKGKEANLQLLDSIAYAHRNRNYDANLSKLRTYNEALAKWDGENSPKHWPMSKFTKKKRGTKGQLILSSHSMYG